MSVTVTCKLSPGLILNRTGTLVTGASGNNLAIALPSQVINGVVAPNAAVALTVTKAWSALLALTVSTPVDLDLSALVGGNGDTSFSDVKLLDIRSQADPATGPTLLVGGSGGASEWYDPFGTAAGAILPVLPGTTRQFYNLATGGWDVSTRKILRLDPQAFAHNVLVTIAGD